MSEGSKCKLLSKGFPRLRDEIIDERRDSNYSRVLINDGTDHHEGGSSKCKYLARVSQD